MKSKGVQHSVESNQTEREYPTDVCIHELFERQVGRTADAVAVVWQEARVSYQELNRRANQVAHYLRRLGVGPEVRVGVLLERSVEMIVSMFGILKAGGVYVPLEPRYPAERLAFIMADAELEFLITQRHWQQRLGQSVVRQVIAVEEESWRGEDTKNPELNVTGENLAYVFYTSGSTGVPKGVMVQHSAMSNYATTMAELYEISVGDQMLQFAPISFDASAEEIFTTLVRGASLVLRSEEMLSSPETFLRQCEQLGITVLDLPTAYWNELVVARKQLGQSLRLVVFGGEKAQRERVQQWQDELRSRVRLINIYGPTETTVGATTSELREWDGAKECEVPIGRAVDNVEVYVLDQRQERVGAGITAELYIGGAGVARGYLGRPEQTAERFVPHAHSQRGGERLYRTGDLARYRENGELEFVGRLDHQVKIWGMRVELGEIEAVLYQHPSVKEAVVVVKEYSSADNRLVAYVVTERNDSRELRKELRKYLQSKLSQHMVPTAIVSLAALPLTLNDKVDRNALPNPDDFLEPEAEYVAPRTPVEEILATIWSEVLVKDRVGVQDDFFSLGGDSLLTTMVITRVRQLLKIELSQRMCFEATTVAELARHVERIKQSREDTNGETGARGISKNLSDLSPSERAALVMRLKKKPAALTPEQTIERRKDSGPVPLSFAQQRLWFLDQMGYSNYFVSGTSRLTGLLDVKAFERSLNGIVQRHEALRTTFTTIDGQPMQIIAPQLPLTLPVLDLSQLPSDERAAETGRLRKEALQPFNLEKGPLLRASLLRLAKDEHLLLLTMHHIVSDGWSLGVFFRELATLYEGFVEGQTPSLPELPIQYADFAAWQRRWLSGEILERELAYWKKQLSDAPPVLDLPTDLPRPAVPTIEGSFLSCEISKELTEALKNLGRQEGVSLYMTLLAAFKILLARYSGQAEVVVGTPIANRNWIEIESLIGFFVNTLVLRTDLSGNPPFKELLKRIREVTLGAFAHQDMPFEKLVEELQPERDLTRTPFFQVMFSLQNAPLPPLKLSQVTLMLLEDEFITTSQFDLTFDSTERSDGSMEFLLEYSTKIFERATVQRMLTHYTNLLENIVANPQQRIRELPLLTDGERRQILVEWNATARDYPQESCIHQLFEAQAARTPEAIAVVFGEERVTYAELNRRANQLGHYLKQLGVRAETRVGILLERSVEMPIALLGVLKAGGAYVAFDPSYPPERLLYMFEDSDVSVLLTQEKLVAGQSEQRARIVCLETEWSSIVEQDARNVQSDVNASNLAYLVYTSGSTGRPKGILIEHSSVVNASYSFINNHRLTERDRLLQFASLSFDVAAEEFFATWLSGGCVVMRPEQTLSSFAEFTTFLQCENVSIVNLPASFWLEWLTALTDQGGQIPKSLRRVIVGNEKSLEETLAKWQRLIGPTVEWRNAYGPSETTITASNYEPSSTGSTREEKSAVPIGRPVMNVQMYVLDSALQIVPTGVSGELFIGGDGVARGYHKQPAQTAERFLPNPYGRKSGERFYRTGDAARFRADGNIEFLGRVDEQVKIRGFRIEPGEIEAVLAQHESVRESVVVAGDDGRGGQRLIAYVVSHKGDLRTDELREFLKQRLTEYMIPSGFVMMETLPRTPNGKVDRRHLPKADSTGTDANEAYIAPRSATERTIAKIWREVLKVEDVGINDNFFGLGGHSLLLVHAQSKVSEALRVKVSMIEMFKYPTISALAEHLSEQLSSIPSSPLPTRNQAGTRVQSLNRQRQLRQRTTTNR